MFNFSLLHSSARPEKWAQIFDEWISLADDLAQVQYILVGDQRWGFDKINPGTQLRDTDTYVNLYPSRRCYVEGVNLAARYSRGRTLVVIADDQHPCQGWDTHLSRVIVGLGDLQGAEYVIRVSTGTPTEIERNITVMPIVSRSRYQRLGYVLYPGYESMYSDNDLTEHAQQDGVFIDARDLPEFPHRHPFWTDARMDKQYESQNRKEAYLSGANLLTVRRATKFGTATELDRTQAQTQTITQRKTIAVCLPGETFSSIWVSSWTELFLNLFSRFNTVPIFCFSSNVHVTRNTLAKQIIDNCGGLTPDYILWIDDDNPVLWSHVEMLLADLEGLPDADGVSGWCWIHDQANSRYVMSCGLFNTDSWTCINYTIETFNNQPYDLIQFQFTGFPLFLMRGLRPLIDPGPHPFAPIMEPSHPYGAMSEDTAYCRRAMEAGLKFYVDRRVKVDHLKTGPLGPGQLPTTEQLPGIEHDVSPAAEILTGSR